MADSDSVGLWLTCNSMLLAPQLENLKNGGSFEIYAFQNQMSLRTIGPQISTHYKKINLLICVP